MKIKPAPEITDSSLSLSRETDRRRKDGEKDNEGAEGWKYAEQLLQAALAWYQQILGHIFLKHTRGPAFIS